MRVKCLAVTFIALAMAATSVAAATVYELYEDATAEAAKGKDILESADWQFRDGNVQEGCRIMEQARLHYEKAYGDMTTMEDMVNDPANGYTAQDRQAVLDWATEQKAAAGEIAGRMAETWQAKCQ